MLFHTGKSGVFIGPNDFKNGAKKYLIMGFRGTGSTTASTRQYHCLLIDTKLYDRLTKPQRLGSSGITT